jgi:ABC-2 type transport system permease protein
MIAHVGEVKSVSGLWPAVGKLLRLRVLLALSSFRHANKRHKFGIIFLGLLFIGFLGFIFFLSWVLLRFLRSPELALYVGDLQPLLDSVPVLLLGGAFVGILFTSFGVLLQALYLAGDMDFLLSTPLPIRAVFLTKLLQAILPNLGLISVFALPVLFGLGVSSNYNILYYPMVLVVLLALALAAAGLSSLLVLLIVKVFPARRVAEVLGFLGAVFSFICSQSGQFAQFEDVSQDQAAQLAALVSRFNTPWSPLTWAGRGLVDLGEGRWLAAAGFLAISLGLSALIFGTALTTAEKLYYTGWANIQGKTNKKKTRSARKVSAQQQQVTRFFETRVPAAIRAILIKDYYVLRRDLRNMSQLVTPIILGIAYAFLLVRNGGEISGGRGNAPAIVNQMMENAPLYLNIGISLFVSWMLIARLAGIGFSQEGRSYWLLKTAPINASTMLAAKFLVAFLPATLLGWLFLLVMAALRAHGFDSLWFSMLVVALNIAGNTGLNLMFGVLGANLEWDDPRHMMRSSVGCLGSLASFIYFPISLLFFFGPPVGLALVGVPVVAGQLIGLAIGGVVSLGFALIPLLSVRKRVDQLGEPKAV